MVPPQSPWVWLLQDLYTEARGLRVESIPLGMAVQ